MTGRRCPMERFPEMLAHAWGALGGTPAAAAQVELTGGGPYLPSALPVDELACATFATALLAAAELASARGRGRAPAVSFDAAHVAAAFRSERFVRVDGETLGQLFDPMSSFMRAADGWVRLHGNYPHHRAALRRALGVGPDAGHEAVRQAVAARRAVDVEEAVVAAGGCAAAVRDPAAWVRHPQGAAVASQPLLDMAPGLAEAPPLPPLADDAPPGAGLRVLDLTRVIAGPVATRFLAALGCEVLRVDPPGLPEIPLQAVDTGAGKRSTLLDLRDRADRATFEDLLAEADVLVQAYRPGALAAFGLDAASLAERHPGLTTVTLSAWGGGPWAGRRGFDSLVQAATGIATTSAQPGSDAPGALPAQALDHGTGYLVAAAALRGLARRATEGRALHARLALARTAAWLLAAGPRQSAASAEEVDPAPFLEQLDSPLGTVTVVGPPGRLDGQPLRWARGPVALGADAPVWSERSGARP